MCTPIKPCTLACRYLLDFLPPMDADLPLAYLENNVDLALKCVWAGPLGERLSPLDNGPRGSLLPAGWLRHKQFC